MSAYGGLPLFSSGNRVGAFIDHSNNSTSIRFSEPCDASHIQIVRSEGQFARLQFRCARSLELIGWVEKAEIDGINGILLKLLLWMFISKKNFCSLDLIYVAREEDLLFLPLDIPWPVECQPENFWGTEGQYRSWGEKGSHELSSRPLSY